MNSATTKPTSFEQKITKLKSKPNQKVLEDEYIKVYLLINIFIGLTIIDKVSGIWTKITKGQIDNLARGR